MRCSSRKRFFVTGLFALCVPTLTVVGQVRVELTPYAGVYVPHGSLTSPALLKQEASLSLGTRVTIWPIRLVGIEGIANYAPSKVVPTQTNSSFPGPSSAQLVAASAEVIVRLLAANGTTGIHLGSGVGRVSYGGPAYSITDGFLQANGTTFSSWLVTAGAAFRLGQSVALRIDVEEYVYSTSFRCRSTVNAAGICWAVSRGALASERQNDLVASLGLAIRVAPH